MFQSSGWMPIGEINGQTICGMHVAYDELGRPRCRYAVMSDEETVYTLGTDELGRPLYTAESEPGRPSYQPSYYDEDDVRRLPATLSVRQGWRISPRHLASGLPSVFKIGGSEHSANRPSRPDFSDPAAVAKLDELVKSFCASLPAPPVRIDLYRACEGDNPSLMRTE